MFERGKEFERGLRPLSSLLPSSAINTCDDLSVAPGWRGDKGVRLHRQSNAKKNP
jgi:hypothetical protein